MQALLLSPQALFFVAPSPFFVAPSEARGPAALAHLGMTSWYAVPKEGRTARLALGRTKKDAQQDGVGNFFEQPQRQLRTF